MKLEEICHFIVDCPHSTAEDEGAGYPLIRTPNIGKGCFILEGVHRVSEEVYNIRNKRAIPQDDDLIFAREAPAGNVAIIKNGEKYCLGQRTVLIRPNKDVVDPDFLTYYLLAPQQQHNLLKTENGSTASHVNMPIIRGLEIVLPEDKAIQQKIGCVLSEYDELIAINRKKIQVLEEMAMRTYREWFVHMRFPGHETTPIKDGLPEGWKYAEAQTFFKISIGKTPPRSESQWFSTPGNGIPWLSIADMSNTIYSLETAETLTDEAIKQNNIIIIPKDTILLSFKLTVGRVAIAPFDICTNEAIAHFPMMNKKAKEYTYCYLKFFNYHSLGSTSSLATAVNSKIIKRMPFMMPTKEVLDQFHHLTKPLLDEILFYQQQIRTIQQMRDKLLPQLMSGQFKVKP